MSNHCTIKTKKHMTPESIESVLKQLNDDYFKGVIKWDLHKSTKESLGWGDFTWKVTVDNVYGERIFWLNGKNHFEICHGGGGWFIWWIDHIITNGIARNFNGTICDEGDGKKVKPEKLEKYSTFESYLKLVQRIDTDRKNKITAWFAMQEEMQDTPEIHRFDTGPKIEMVKDGDNWICRYAKTEN